jgi:ATP-binding protein involved in chromosome partitioning
MNPQMPPKMSLPGVKHVLAVASGKGGVGKSTVAANLALALHMAGQKVGLMDADIYGPSVPIMFGLGQVDPQRTPFPLEKYGLKLMSMGFMVDPNQAVIWRGPKVAQAVQAFLGQIPWGELDFLVIDLPPGTGDAQLTLSQSAPLTGAVIVTTPQDVSLIDARVAECGDTGEPIVRKYPDSPIAKAYKDLAERVIGVMATASAAGLPEVQL